MRKLTLFIGILFLVIGLVLLWINPFNFNPYKTIINCLGIFVIYIASVAFLTFIEKKWANKMLKYMTPPDFPVSFDYYLPFVKGLLMPFGILFGFWTTLFMLTYVLPYNYCNEIVITINASVFLSLTLGTLIYVEFGNKLISIFSNYNRIPKNKVKNDLFKFIYWDELKTYETSLRILNQQRFLFVIFVAYAILLFVSSLIEFQCDSKSDFFKIIIASFSIVIAYDRVKSKLDLLKK
jgi:hypothetical protein